MRMAVLTLALALCACAPASPAQTATPTPLRATVQPSAEPSPGEEEQSSEMQGADPEEVVQAFLVNVQEVVDEARFLAELPCEELRAMSSQNPAAFSAMRGYAQTLQRVGTQDGTLMHAREVASALVDLEQALGNLDAALSTCGLSLG